MSRIVVPSDGRVIWNTGVVSLKSTPLRIRSCLLGMSLGCTVMEFVEIRVSIYSISSQTFPVLGASVVEVNPAVEVGAPEGPDVSDVPADVGETLVTADVLAESKRSF